MNGFSDIFYWFSGGERQYHTLYQCMMGDNLWIAITVILDLAVATGYALIAKHWWDNSRLLPPTPAKRALGNLRNIFLFCGICGYLFIPIKMFWPAWRLYDIFLAALVFFTWRYAIGARDLKVIYKELGQSTQLQEDLDKSRDESNRKTFFLNAISHDLRTPLNGLLLQANLAELGAASNDAGMLQGAIKEIKASARASANLLDDLLEYARLDWSADNNAVVTVPLAECIGGILQQHQVMAAEKDVTLKSVVATDLVFDTDRLKLERILSNLFANAVKFTDVGSVRVEASRSRRGLEIHVIDTGIGVAPEDRKHLFNEFFQARNIERDRQKGFGLGLAIAQRLANQLGGEITVDSTLGKGSRFTVVLPVISAVQTGKETRPGVHPELAAT